MYWSKLTINSKNDDGIIIPWHKVVIFLLRCNVSPVKVLIKVYVGYHEFWKFLFIKDLRKNPGIRNTPVWVLSNIWRLRWVEDTTLGTNVCSKKLFDAAKCHIYSFNRFWVITGKAGRRRWGGGGSGGKKIYSATTPSLLNSIKYLYYISFK